MVNWHFGNLTTSLCYSKFSLVFTTSNLTKNIYTPNYQVYSALLPLEDPFNNSTEKHFDLCIYNYFIKNL